MIYIYPYGNFGKSIEKCLKLFNLQYDIIDDSNNKISLNHTNIDSKNDIVLICIAKNPNQIIDKLNLKGNFNHIDGVLYCLDILKTEFKFDKPNHSYEDILAELFGITNCLDQNSTSRSEFVKFFNQYGNFINNYYKNKFKNIKIWGGIDVSFSNMKHLYKIPSILEQNGLNLIYIFQTKYYKEDPNKKFIIILNYYLWHFLDFLPNILSSANMKVSNNTKLYFIEHAYCTPRVLPIISDNPKQELNGYLLKNKNNINLIGNKQDYEICEKIYNSIIVKAGYPSIDKNLENYSNDCKKEWVMIAFVDDAIDENSAFNLAKVLLENGYKVIARVHPAFKENMKKLYSISNLNFIFDGSSSPIESFKNSFTVITNHSSLAHTYPLTTLRKAILFMPNSILDKEIYGKTFFDENLHLKATNFDEILLNLKELEAKKDDLYEQEKIRSYRNNEVYNLGHSSEFIAGFILGKWGGGEGMSNFNMKIIKAGYPSLDKNIDKYKHKQNPKYILISFFQSNAVAKDTIKLVKFLIKNRYMIIIRLKPGENDFKCYSELDNKSIIYDDGSDDVIHSFENSFTLITDYSSIAHTYPLTTLRKAILFMPNSILDKEIYGKTFFDENLHLKATNFDEILLNLKELEAKKDDLYEQEKIRSYRNNEVYNLGHSSEFIANFILEKLKEK